MDPKIAKKTQDSLGKYIKKPPLTEKLLAKPPFRFLHDVMTSIIKTTGVMNGLYSADELNSENVKDRDSKIAFLQKAIDYVGNASGKQLSVKPAKIVAGHEPEKTNEFLQALAHTIGSKGDNENIVDSVKGGGKASSGKKEDKEESRPREREKSSDRRKRDDDKRSRDREEKGSSKDRDERRKDRDDKHKDRDDKHRDRDDKHKDRDDKHREKEDKHREKDDKRDRERDRENRHKSGRSRAGIEIEGDNNVAEADMDNSAETEGCHAQLYEGFDNGEQSGHATFSVLNPAQIERPSLDHLQPVKHMERQKSAHHLSKRRRRPATDEHKVEEEEITEDSNDEDFGPEEYYNENSHTQMTLTQSARPKAARTQRKDTNAQLATDGDSYTSVNSMEEKLQEDKEGEKGQKSMIQANSRVRKGGYVDDAVLGEVVKDRSRKSKSGPTTGPLTSTPKTSPRSSNTAVRRSTEIIKSSVEKQGPYGNKYSDPSQSYRRKKEAQVKNQTSNPKLQGMQSKQKNAKSLKTKLNDRKRDVIDIASDIHSNEGETLNLPKEPSRKVVHNKKTKLNIEQHGVKASVREPAEKGSGSDTSISKHRKKKYSMEDFAHDKVKERHAEGSGMNLPESKLSDTRTEKVGKEEKGRARNRDGKHRNGTLPKEQRLKTRPKEEEGKENDAPKDSLVNGDHNQTEAPAKMPRPSSAKGSRRRMEAPVTFTEGGNLSSDEDVPAQRAEQTLGNTDDQTPPQPAGRLARPSSARPAPPKRKDDITQQEPTMRLGSGKPQNLILDDGKDSDEDETFVVEDTAPPSPKQQQATLIAGEEEEEDHGGLVKKIMESKKEYEQPRETKIERPAISDAQRRKQREAVQREIDKLRGSIQTLTRSANPLGKIMDYVQEDLDSMQKELQKWKTENKEHALALKREKAITERAVEPLKVQLSGVDQAIKDQLELIGAVKSNIIRNDQKIEKMLRTIAKS